MLGDGVGEELVDNDGVLLILFEVDVPKPLIVMGKAGDVVSEVCDRVSDT